MTPLRTAVALAAVLGWVGAAQSARAWTPIAGAQPTWSGTAPYSLHQSGSDDLGGYDGTLPIVRAGMDDWALLECSGLHTSFEGSTSGVPFSSGSNVVGWIESSWIDSPSAIGITGPSWNGSGDIVDAQMAMNGVHFTWTTESGSGSRVNAYSITLHEAGHYYGLGHSSDSNATMYYAYSGGILRLNADDQEGICTLYPGGGGGTTPPPDDGGGTDPPPDSGGDVTFCGPCTSDADCAGTGSLCLRYPDGMSYCGQACGSDAECDRGTCEMVSDGSRQCIRRDETGAPDCNATTDPGTDPGTDPPPDDGSGTDPGPDTGCTTDSDCGSGATCDTATGTCVPRRGGALGDACTTNDQCESGLCAMDIEAGDSFCTQLCDASQPCPAGFECADAEGGASACRPMAGGLGDACTGPADCLSGLCAQSDTGTFCTRECVGTGACPDGFECMGTESGGPSVCAENPAGAADVRGLTGGCSAAAGRTDGSAGLLVLLPLALLLRRGRRISA